jgi:2'-5' RNA ligase
MANFGYIQIEFENKFKESLVEWSKKSIDSKYLTYGEIDGKSIGGFVIQDAHITLVYGIPSDTEYSEEIQQEVQKIILPKIRISGIKSFYIKEYGAKILYLLIDDENGDLEKIHKKFEKFISEELKQAQPLFVPHIAIAYVSESFDENSLMYDGQSEIQNIGVKYYKS